MLTQEHLRVESLGPCELDSPLASHPQCRFVDDQARVRYRLEVGLGPSDEDTRSFELAGPRRRIFFEPARTTAAVVTCGGLCPGLNNVIRSITLELWHNYGVRRLLGIRDGYRGLVDGVGREPLELVPDRVQEIQYAGGTALGSSRGPQDVGRMVDFLTDRKIDILFCVGGDGTQRGAAAIGEEARRRGLAVSVVGIPKTIDNDVMYVSTSFGFSTALERAEQVLRAAHVEAKGAPNGVGLVKLMGRDAGFIAAGAALASSEANFVLIPEVPFPLEGPGGLLDAVESRIRRRGHALVVVAEGAGQHLLEGADRARDPSGNLKHVDIGTFLRDRIVAHFADRRVELNLKYLDPSYYIRSVPANTRDRILCDQLARHAAHAAMAGKTGLVIGTWGLSTIHVPIGPVVASKKHVETTGDLWNAVLNATGQPRW